MATPYWTSIAIRTTPTARQLGNENIALEIDLSEYHDPEYW